MGSLLNQAELSGCFQQIGMAVKYFDRSLSVSTPLQATHLVRSEAWWRNRTDCEERYSKRGDNAEGNAHVKVTVT